MKIAALLAALVAAGCDRHPPAAAAPPPAGVDVAKPLVREIVEWDEYTGRLGAIEAVDVRARVSGFLEAIHFKDGQTVKKGDPLFTLDARPFKASLDAVAGDARQAASRLDLARREYARVKAIGAGAVSGEEIDTRAKAVEAAQATLDAAKAREERARLDLEFAEVRAPMDGRIGRHAVSVGNLVSGGTSDSTVLTNIVTLDPIYCYFDISEQAFLKYTRLDKAGLRASSRDKPNPVRVALLDETEFTHTGHMDFVDNQIDGLTGTLRGRALLDNAGFDLLPGVFVKLRLPGSGKYRAVLVPDRAVTADQSDRFVYVVGEGNVVKQRRVVPGRLYEGLRIITTGLDGSESVVVDGVQRVRVGAVVAPETTTLTLAPAAKPAVPGDAPAPAAKEVAK